MGLPPYSHSLNCESPFGTLSTVPDCGGPFANRTRRWRTYAQRTSLRSFRAPIPCAPRGRCGPRIFPFRCVDCETLRQGDSQGGGSIRRPASPANLARILRRCIGTFLSPTDRPHLHDASGSHRGSDSAFGVAAKITRRKTTNASSYRNRCCPAPDLGRPAGDSEGSPRQFTLNVGLEAGPESSKEAI